MTHRAANSVIVLDFETTGLSPTQGDRAIEIGAIKIQDGIIVDTFQELMNPGFKISGFIAGYTGITNTMLESAAPCDEVMNRFADFIGNDNLVAHNASFDQRFLDAELSQINRDYGGEFACSLLVARRLYQDAPNHKLGTLVEYKQIENDGVFHRALADTQVTVKLWLAMLEDMQLEHHVSAPSFKFMQQLSKKSKAGINAFLAQASKA